VSPGLPCPSLAVVWRWPRRGKEVAGVWSRCYRQGEERLKPNQELLRETRPKGLRRGKSPAQRRSCSSPPRSSEAGHLRGSVVTPGRAGTRAEPGSSAAPRPCSWSWRRWSSGHLRRAWGGTGTPCSS